MQTFLNCKKLFKNSFSLEREKFLIMMGWWPELAGGEKKPPNGWDRAGEGLGDALGAAADLLKSAGEALKWGVEKAQVGVVYAGHKIEKLVEWIQDPGKPDENLPIYKEITSEFVPDLVPNGGLTGDDMLDSALRMHGRLLFLNFNTSLYTELTRPAMEEYKNVDDRIGLIQSNKFSLDSKIKEYDDKIDAIDKILEDGLYMPGTLQDIQLRTEKQQLESQKHYFESLTSYTVKWRKPEIQMVEFPAGSGKIIERFVPSDSEEVELDLRQLKQYLGGFTSGYKAELARVSYKDEKEKLAYHRDKFVEKFLEKNEKSLLLPNRVSGTPGGQYDEFERIIKVLDGSASDLTGQIDFPIKAPQARADLEEIGAKAARAVLPMGDIGDKLTEIRDKAVNTLLDPSLAPAVKQSLEKIRDEANNALAITPLTRLAAKPNLVRIFGEVTSALKDPSLGIKPVNIGSEEVKFDIFQKTNLDLQNIKDGLNR